MVHQRREAWVLLLLAAAAFADVAVPREGAPIRGAVAIDAERGRVRIGEAEPRSLDDFLLIERDGGELVWARDFAARLEGYRRLVYSARRAELVELAKEAVRARDARLARRLYEWARREGLDGRDERIVRKRVQKLESRAHRIDEERAAPVRAAAEELERQLPALLLDRAKRARDEDGLRLLRAALAEAPRHPEANELLSARAPEGHPFEDARAWLSWHLDLERRGFVLVPEDHRELKRVRHYWRPDLIGIESSEIRLFTPVRDVGVLRDVALRGHLALAELRRLFATDTPLKREEEPLAVHLFVDRRNFDERIGDPVVAPLPPWFYWSNARWSLRGDVTRLLHAGGAKERKDLLYCAVHELARHWLWSRNPRYSAAQLMSVDAEVSGYWAVVGLVGLLAEAEYDLDEGAVDVAAAGDHSRAVVRKADAVVAWRKFFLLNASDVARLGDEKTAGGWTKSYLFARQATVVCHYLWTADGGRLRLRLADFVVDHYLGRQPKMAPSVAFGLSAEELGRLALDHGAAAPSRPPAR